MALAYNVGFHLPEAKLWPWEGVKYFPHGNLAEFTGQKNTDSYADLAAGFFARTNLEWCNFSPLVVLAKRASNGKNVSVGYYHQN